MQHCPRTEAPALRRRYPASAVLRVSRHPRGPGLARAGWRLAHTPRLRLGLPLLPRSRVGLPAVATTPAESRVARIARFPSDGGLPQNSGGSACALPFARPASRSLRVRACMRAEPLTGSFTPKASAVSLPPRPLRLLPAGAIVAGWESHPRRERAFARRTEISGLGAPLTLAGQPRWVGKGCSGAVFERTRLYRVPLLGSSSKTKSFRSCATCSRSVRSRLKS